MSHNGLSAKEILNMIKNGQISSEEGISLIKKAQVQGTKNAETISSEEERLYFHWKWNEMHLDIKYNGLKDKGNLILFDIDRVLFEELSELNKREGSFINIILVLSGSKYSRIDEYIYEINIKDIDDYKKLFNDLKLNGITPDYIIYSLSKNEFSFDEENLNSSLDEGVFSLFLMTKSLLETKQNNAKLLFTYPGSLVNTQPQYSGVSGFVKTLNKEHEGFNYRIVGTSNTEKADMARILVEEFKYDDGSIDILYADGKRYVKALEEISAERIKDNALPIKPEGVYIITGGAGGIGKVFSHYLAYAVSAKLVIAGRSDLNGQTKKLIKDLTELGSEVLYVRTDITKKNEVKKLVESVRTKFGEINGVIHCAGVLNDSMISKKPRKEFYDVIAPKVYGTVFLDECTANDKLDFFVCFSSIAVMGNIGQSDYAYANRFMDTYIEMRNGMLKKHRRHGKAVSINWPLWESGRMKISDVFKKQMKDKMGIIPLDDENGVRGFCDAVRLGVPQVMVLAGDGNTIRKSVLGEFKYSKPQYEVQNEIINNGSLSDNHNSASMEQSVNIKNKFETFLKGILAAETGIQSSSIMPNEPFEKYGINSVVIIGLNQKLVKYFGNLPKTLLFEFKNITELSSYFVENHWDKVKEIVGEDENYKAAQKSSELKTKGSQANENFRFLKTNIKEEKDSVASREEIAIVGVSGRYPMADDLEQFWEVLKAGKDCITEIPTDRWDSNIYFNAERGVTGKSYSKWGGFINDVDKFDPLFFNISPREAEIIDPQERQFMEIAWQAMEDAGYTRMKLEKDKVGVFVGVMYGHYQLYGTDMSVINNGLLPNTSYASIANRVSYFFNFRGPSIAIDTMCSSSLTSIHLACSSIQKRECDLAVAGGVNLTVHPNKYLLLSQGQFLSSDGKCRSFGDGGDGYVPGEGVGAVILKPLKNAIRDGDYIYAVIKGSSLNHGGKTNGYTVPNPIAQGELISKVLQDSGINPGSISYIETHGTGTSLGDPIEISGLMKAFNPYTKEKQFCAIGSVKSNIGHLESAAGIAGLTKILLQMRHKMLAPSLHSEVLNKNIDFEQSQFYVQQMLQDWKKPVVNEGGKEVSYPRRAAVSSFGAGGSNAHIILEEWEINDDYVRNAEEDSYLILLSAKNRDRLKEYSEKMCKFLEKRNDESYAKYSLRSIAYTLQQGREEMDERLALVVSSIDELCEKLKLYASGSTNISEIYYGNVKQNQDNTRLLIDGRAGKEFIKAIVEDKAYHRLAQLWVNGVSIEWELLYREYKVSRVPLPTYPFERKSYWIKPDSNNPLNQNTIEKLHALIGRNTSTLNEERFTTRLTGNEFYFADYIKGEKSLLPQSVTIEMARVAGELAALRKVRKIKDVVWGQPIRINEFPSDIHVSLYSKDDIVEYEVGVIRNDGQRMALSQGKLYFEEQPEAQKNLGRLDIGSISQRCPVVKNKDEYYGYSVKYGSSFKVVQEMHIGEGEVVFLLKLPNELKPGAEDFVLHPALLDGALQSIMEYISNLHNEAFAFVKKIDEIEISEALTNICYVDLLPTHGSGDMHETEFDVAFTDDSGNIMLKLKGLTVSIGAQNQHISKKQVYKTSGIAESSAIDEVQLRQRIIHNMKAIISELLKIEPDKLDENEGFGSFGFESIALKQLADNLSENYGIEISPAVFFAQSNINGLSDYLLKEYKEKMISVFGASKAPQVVGLPERELDSTKSEVLGAVHLEPLINKYGNMGRVLYGDNKNTSGFTPEPIAIIGMSGMFPLSKNLEEFWSNLELEKDLITEVPEDRWNWKDFYSGSENKEIKTKSKWGGFVPDVDKFDPRFFNISPAEAEMMDPQQRLFLESVWKAIEDAGYKASDLSGKNVGIFSGIQFKDYQQLLAMQGESNAMMGLGNEHSIFVNRISYLLNFHGPSEPYDTACSSAAVAIHRAIKSIWFGESELALAGGISLMLSPSTMISADQLGILSPDGKCKTLDKSANGYVKGEGVGALLLKPLSKAIMDNDNIYAVIKGSSVNHGGKASSLTAPNSSAQASLLVSAYKEAGIDPETVTYLELHGTGTELGDPVEIEGIKSAFKQLATSAGKEIKKRNFCGIGSVKTNIGHLEPASGIAGVMKVILAMKNKKLPGILHLKELNPYIDLKDSPFYVTKGTRAWERICDESGNYVPRRAGVSSFGFGGVNAHIVLEEFYRDTKNKDSKEPVIIVLSAKNEDRLKEYALQMLDYLKKKNSKSNLAGINTRIGETELLNDILNIVAQTVGFDIKDIDPSESAVYQGIDKVAYSVISQRILEKYNINVDTLFISSFNTLNDFVENLYKENKNVLDEYYLSFNSASEEVQVEVSSLRDIAYTLQTGREEMAERLACVASSIDEVIEKLIKFTNGATEFNNFFRGSTKGKNGAADVLSDFIMDGEEGQRIIANMIEKKKLDKLAKYWVLGGKLDWKQLYGGEKPFKVSLPTYPFARERYWAPKSISELTDKKSDKAQITMNSALDRFDKTASSFKGKEAISANKSKLPQELLPINTKGKHQPSFWVHGAPGFGTFFTNLSKSLGPDYPIYCFQAKGIDNKSMPQKFEDLVPYYIECVHIAQPEGPYILGGYSYGGLIAYEMARQMSLQGDEITKLIMFDTFPATDEVVKRFYSDYERDFFTIFMANEFANARENPEALIAKEDMEGIPDTFHYAHAAKLAKERGGSPLPVDEIYNYIRGAHMCSDYSEEAYKGYNTLPYAGSDVLFFKATRGYLAEDNWQKWRGSDLFADYDYIKPWRDNIGKDMKIVELPSDHFCQLDPPSIHIVTKHVKEVIPDNFVPKQKKIVVEKNSKIVNNGSTTKQVENMVNTNSKNDKTNKKQSDDEIIDYIIYELKLIVAEKMKISFDEINEDVNVAEYGVDSILSSFIMQMVQDKFGNTISLNAIIENPTLRQLAQRIKSESNIDVAENEHNLATGKPQPRSEKREDETEYQTGPAMPYIEDFLGSMLHYEKSLDMGKYEVFKNKFLELTSFAHTLLLDYFCSMNVFDKPGKRYTLKTLKSEFKIIPEYDRLFDALIDILEREGLVRINGEKILVTKEIENEKYVNGLKNIEETKAYIAQMEDVGLYIPLLYACYKEYPRVLQGKISNTEVLFPNGSMHLVSDIYKGNMQSDYYNEYVARIAKDFVYRKSNKYPDVKIRILEVGAGTGGTSVFVLNALKEFKEQISYYYTDISLGFVQYGMQLFSRDNPFIVFKELNIENSPESQGYKKNSFDLVFCSNVLHTTARIDNTLTQVRSLLKKDGLLIINELTQLIDYNTLTFGLTDGWWLFDDVENRVKGSPVLSTHKWRELLNGTGFKNIRILGLPGVEEEEFPQSLILGENSSEV